MLGVAAAAPLPAQELPSQVLALYPPQAGELVFVDLQSARRSPHYTRLKEQVLPDRYRELDAWARRLGIDFDRNVNQLSWAFVSSGDAANSDFVGVAEGSFFLDDIRDIVAKSEISATDYAFGFREQVMPMLDRNRQGGRSLLDNTQMRDLIADVNRRASIWLVFDGEFTELGVRQFLGDATQIPGAEALAERVQNATLRLELDRGLETNLAARCASSTDAVWFGAFLEAALYFQRQRLNESNPALARILADAQLGRAGDQLTLDLDITESDMPALLQARSFTLSF
jgi:hypothetical protein